MIYWIFDLDNTLYQGNLSNYDQLKPANQLVDLIKKLPGKKILFTNGTGDHAKMCINKMNMNHLFDFVIHRNLISAMKPDFVAYYRMMNICNINKDDSCLFFEDSIVNLISAKKLGWKTVFISSYVINNNSIDYNFSNVYKSLAYFHYLINNS